MQKGSVSPAAARKQKLGRKVIMYGRMSHAIEAKISKLQPSKKSVVAPVGMAFKKVIRNIGHGILSHKIISAAAVLLLLGGFVGWSVYSHQRQIARQAEQKRQQEAAAASAKRVSECEKRKADANKAKFGTATYDELYDYGACRE